MNEIITVYITLSRLRHGRQPLSPTKRRLALAGAGAAMATSVAITIAVGLLFAFYTTTTAAYPPLGDRITVHGAGITTVYDRNGQPLGVLSNPNSAIASPVALEQISPALINATISTEDNEFWGHHGFDVRGLARAAWSNYVTHGVTTGGSTITQQLVKTEYFTTECTEVDGLTQCSAPRTASRKAKEVMLAIRAEGDYSKDQILDWYLNAISYSGRYIGAEAASQGYFHKPAAELTLAEAAVLAGIPSAPTQYNPRTNCVMDETGNVCQVDDQGRTVLAGDAKARQEYVLDLMVEHGRATNEDASAAKGETVAIYPDKNENLAGAFIDDQVEPRLVRMCEAGVLPQAPGTRDCAESVHTAGYRVTSTLNWDLNAQASAMVNKFVAAGLAAGCDCHNGSVVTIDPSSGQVMVYVPNIDPTWVSDIRVAGNIDQAAEMHQPGSSFKPAVYLSWMDGQNKTPMSTIWDTNPINLVDKPAKPQDQVTISNPSRSGVSQGLITARAALGGSQNVPAFRAATEAGVDNVIAMGKALGITTLDQGFDPTFRDHNSVYYGPSIATGGANIRVIDMAYMDATIANMGVMVGVPTYASTLEVKDALSVNGAQGDALERALNQRDAFLHGHLRLPGTRTLDPVVVMKVESADGRVLYELGDDLVKKPVVNPGSVWMVHSIMSDCTARFLIWGCGSSNDDLALDFFVNGVKIPGGVKTGTQQAATAASTLETWMTGYSRYAASAVWIGNADKSPVRDGPEANYASANATVRLFKNWMGAYHAALQSAGVFQTPAGFDDLKPANVTFGNFPSPTTERGKSGGCGTMVQGWYRTDINYLGGDCLNKSCVPLPKFKPELAVTLAYSMHIPACGLSTQAAPSPTPENGTPPAGSDNRSPQNPPNRGPTQPTQATATPPGAATPKEPPKTKEPEKTKEPNPAGQGGGN